MSASSYPLAVAFATVLVAAVVLFAVTSDVTPQSQPQSTSLQRGEYLAHIMDCAGCHTPGALKGEPDFERRLAGSKIGFHVPGQGVVFPSNLTPHPETGLGNWTVEEIMRAVRTGERPDGSKLVPIMPWPEYSHLTDADARALAEYLKSLPAIEHATPARAENPEEATHPYLTIELPE